MSWQCSKCGAVDYVLVDGYTVGDRLLEGVMFQCRKGEDGKISVKIDPEFADYFSELNEKKWLKEVAEYAQDNDIFTCHKCGGDIGDEE